MKRRHSNHANNGGQHRRPQGRHGGNFQARPNKNYPALREKFMNMAKDAMSMGDRVLAEYYLQHADHYFRMHAEFLAERAERQKLHPQAEQQEEMADNAQDNESAAEEITIANNSNVLPAFLTQQLPQSQQANNEEQEKALAAASAGWEEE